MAERQQFEFLVLLPDHAGVQAKRQEVRAEHIAGVKPKVAAGELVLGGAFFDKPGGTPVGTALIIKATNEDEVKAALQSDAYSVNKVWDWSKAQILPFNSVVRVGL